MDCYSSNDNFFNNRSQNDTVLSSDDRKKVKKNLLKMLLKGQHSKVYFMHEYDGLSLSEISIILGLKYDTVKKYKQRANKKINFFCNLG